MEGLTEEQAALEQADAEQAAEDARLVAEAGGEPRLEMTTYVVQKMTDDARTWFDLETVEIPRKAPRKNALMAALEGHEDVEGSYRVIPVSIATALVVKVQTTQAAVIE